MQTVGRVRKASYSRRYAGRYQARVKGRWKGGIGRSLPYISRDRTGEPWQVRLAGGLEYLQ